MRQENSLNVMGGSWTSIPLLGTSIGTWWQWWLHVYLTLFGASKWTKRGWSGAAAEAIHCLSILCAHGKWRERGCKSLSHKSCPSLQMCWTCSPHCTVPSYNFDQGQGLLAAVPGPPPLSSWVSPLLAKKNALNSSKLLWLGDLWMPPNHICVNLNSLGDIFNI